MAQPNPPETGLREQNKRDKLARITAAARHLFRTQGFEATTAREICARARIGTGTLFLYVRDKRELLFLTFEADARALFAEGKAAAEGEDTLVAQLMCLFGRFIDYYARDPELSKAIVQELFFRVHEPGGLGRLTREFAEHVSELVARAQSAREVRDDVPPAVAAMTLFAHYAYWMLGWLGTGMISRQDVQPGLRRALELAVAGLASRKGEER